MGTNYSDEMLPKEDNQTYFLFKKSFILQGQVSRNSRTMSGKTPVPFSNTQLFYIPLFVHPVRQVRRYQGLKALIQCLDLALHLHSLQYSHSAKKCKKCTM